MLKKLLVGAAFVLSLSLLCAETVIPPGDWLVREFSPGESSFPQTLSLEGYVPFEGGPIPNSASGGIRKISFVREISLPPAGAGRSPALLVGPSDYPAEFYLNGTLVGRIGHYQDYYNSTVYRANRFLLPEGETGSAMLAVEVFATYEVTALPVLKVGDWNELDEEVFWRNLLNISFMQVAVSFAAILAAFFILLYFMGSRDRKYLWFVMICVSFAMAYSNMSFYRDSRDVLLLDKLSRWGLPLTSLFLLYFAWELSGFRLGRRALRLGFQVPVVGLVAVSCLRTALGHDKESVFVPFSSFTTGIVLPLLLVLALVLLVATVIKRPRPDTIGAFAGFAAIVASSVHDLILSLSGGIPYVWLVPYGYFGFVLSIFFILALDQTGVLKKTRAQAKVMERQHETLSLVVANLMEVSAGLVESSKTMGDTLNATLGVLEEYGAENRELTETFRAQSRSVKDEVARITERLSVSSERVPQAIANQVRSAKNVTATLQALGTQVRDSLASVEQSNGFISALAADADGSRRVVESSREALSRVEETSERVKSILESIADLSEQTNVLSINAAIESARYGNAGKGFAVIAGEVRKFAGQSQENARLSAAGVTEMSQAIAETINIHDEVRRALHSIIEKSRDAAEQSKAVTGLVLSQERESRAMGESAELMLRESDTLESLSREERAMNEELKQTLTGIAETFARINASMESQGGMQESLSQAVVRMRSVTEENSRHIEKLQASISRAQAATVEEL